MQLLCMHMCTSSRHSWVLLLLLFLLQLLLDAVSTTLQWLLLLLLLRTHVDAKAKLLFVFNVVQLPCKC
jgi:hypothetical protein